MRLHNFRIKNFRSIIDTNDFLLFDDRITTFVGGNGSGKSNILKAIYYIKEDEKFPSDSDFNVKAIDKIAISASFVFDKADEDILKNYGLGLDTIKGIDILVEKEIGKNSTINYFPLNYIDDNKNGFWKNVEEIKSEISKVNFPETSTLKEQLLEILQNQENIENGEKKLEGLVVSQKELLGEKIIDRILEIIKSLNFNINDIVEKIFNNLDIELLSLKNYEIEDRAEIAELNDSSKHPFLFDLLELSGKKSSDFGNKIGRMLDHIEDAASENLSDAINKVWPSHKLKFKIDKNDGGLDFFVYTSLNKTVELSNLSDGEQWFLRFYTKLAVSQKNNKQILWLFDEPGRDLHASSQNDLKKFFENISDKFQIIYTTHQPMMVPWNKLERLFVVENTENNGTLIHKRFWKDSKLGSPLKEALSSFVGEEFFSGKEHIIIEGISDYFFIQGWLRYFQLDKEVESWIDKYNQATRCLMPVDGIEKIPLYCLFLARETKNNIDWLAVVDSSVERDDLVIKKFPTVGLDSMTKKVISITEATGKKDIEEIEEIFSAKEYLFLTNNYYSKNFPNIIMPSLEEFDIDTVKEKNTKKIERLIKQKNPNYKINNNVFSLDKTGISQEFYLGIINGIAKDFSPSTINKFKKIFRFIDDKFNER